MWILSSDTENQDSQEVLDIRPQPQSEEDQIKTEQSCCDLVKSEVKTEIKEEVKVKTAEGEPE